MGEEIEDDGAGAIQRILAGFRQQVIYDTWDKGLPMVYMEKNGDIVKHWKCGFKVKIGNAYDNSEQIKADEKENRVIEEIFNIKNYIAAMFEEDLSVNIHHMNYDEVSNLVCKRHSYEYSGKAFQLSDDYNWEIKKDSRDVICLIPTKKK